VGYQIIDHYSDALLGPFGISTGPGILAGLRDTRGALLGWVPGPSRTFLVRIGIGASVGTPLPTVTIDINNNDRSDHLGDPGKWDIYLYAGGQGTKQKGGNNLMQMCVLFCLPERNIGGPGQRDLASGWSPASWAVTDMPLLGKVTPSWGPPRA